MHRVLVAILAAFDAVLAAAVGIVVVLAPLTLLWVIGLGQSADWGALWPASATIWQLGHLVPVLIALPGEYLAATGIDPAATSFWLSLAPLAFTAFTAIFAARSGARASRADAWFTGAVAGSIVFAALTTLIALTARTGIGAIHLWQAVLFPSLVFAVAATVGAFTVEWSEARTGLVARVRDRIDAAPHGWGPVVGLSVRGAAAALVGLVGAGALAVAVALALRGGEVIALFESGHMDALGATVTTLAQLAYLPTLIVWGLSFVAGPGFALGSGTSVSPAGTQLGVVPGIPLLGVIPESVSSWLLLLALVPVGIGAFAGWIARSRFVAALGEPGNPDLPAVPGLPGAPDAPRILGLPGAGPAPGESVPLGFSHDASARDESARHGEPFVPRLVITVAIAVVSAGGAALLAFLASGSLGPGRLAEVGPQPGPVALAVGFEVLLGAGILLLSPRPHLPQRAPRADKSKGERGESDEIAAPALVLSHASAQMSGEAAHSSDTTAPVPDLPASPPVRSTPGDLDDTAPIHPLPDADAGPSPRRPTALPPID